MSNYPKNLRYGLNRLSGYNTNLFKLQPTNITTVSNGGIVEVQLPSNAIINLHSLSMVFNTAITNSSSTVFAGFPANMDSVIDRMEVLVSGSSVVMGSLQYNTVATIKKRLFNKINKQNTDTKVLSGSYPVDISTADQQAGSFVIDQWYSFLGESAPQFLDTSLLGQISVRLYLADSNILRLSAPKATGQTLSYTLSDIYFTCESISVSDGLYSLSVQQEIASNGFISVPYTNYFTFTNTQSSSTAGVGLNARFNVSSQSVDCLYSVMRNANSTDSYVTGDQAEIDMGGTVLGPDKVAKYFNFTSAGIGSFSYSVNNVEIPNFKMSPVQALSLTAVAKNDTNDNNRGGLVTSSSQALNNYWVACLRLCHAGDLEDPRIISGLDCRGTSSSCLFNTLAAGDGNGINGNVEVFTVAQCSSTLRIGAGKSIEIVL